MQGQYTCCPPTLPTRQSWFQTLPHPYDMIIWFWFLSPCSLVLVKEATTESLVGCWGFDHCIIIIVVLPRHQFREPMLFGITFIPERLGLRILPKPHYFGLTFVVTISKAGVVPQSIQGLHLPIRSYLVSVPSREAREGTRWFVYCLFYCSACSLSLTAYLPLCVKYSSRKLQSHTW